jgi:hypothetical protein
MRTLPVAGDVEAIRVVVDALAAADADVRTVGDVKSLPASVVSLGRVADGTVLHVVEFASLERVRRVVRHTANIESHERSVHTA